MTRRNNTSKRGNLYLGRAGQMAVMGEFLARGWNVAVPEVDVGDDIFVVRDTTGDFWRIQVKTATGRQTAHGFMAQFALSQAQLGRKAMPELTYVFVVRQRAQWAAFVLIDRVQLYRQFRSEGLGAMTARGELVLSFAYRLDEGVATKLTCSGRDFTRYLDNWARWPVLRE